MVLSIYLILKKNYEDSSSLGVVVKPPLTKRPSGQLKTVQMKSTAKNGKRKPMKYGRCGVVGHHDKILCTTPI
jgi:hypothetical protein